MFIVAQYSSYAILSVCVIAGTVVVLGTAASSHPHGRLFGGLFVTFQCATEMVESYTHYCMLSMLCVHCTVHACIYHMGLKEYRILILQKIRVILYIAFISVELDSSHSSLNVPVMDTKLQVSNVYIQRSPFVRLMTIVYNKGLADYLKVYDVHYTCTYQNMLDMVP